MKRFLIFFFALIFSLAGYNNVSACSCAISSPCQMDARSDASFIGKIKSVEGKGNSVVHKVEILKHFIGLEDKTEVEIYTDWVTSCAYSMKEEGTYVIFARVNDKTGIITTGYCSGTKPLSEAEKEVEFLESLKNAEDGKGVLLGNIQEYDERYKFEKSPWKPKEINKIYLESEKGEKFEAEIDETGQYQFRNLTRGKYEVSVLVPERIITTYEIENDKMLEKGFRKLRRKIKVPGSGCSASEYFIFYMNGVISGKVFDADGTPLKKMPVTLFRYDNSDNMPEQNYKFWTNEEGEYIAKGLPPGRYLIGFGIDHSLYINSHFAGYLPVYYPNVSNEKKSIPIFLGEAEIQKEKHIRLFPKLNKRKITGQILFEDGQPARNAQAVFYVRRKVASERAEGGYELKLDSEGRFEIDVYDKTEYWILSRFFDSEDWKTRNIILSSKCYNISQNKDNLPLKVVLTKGSKNCDANKF